MTIEIKIPALPESVSEATIASWRVQVGEQVSRDDVLVDIETDKIVLEVPATADGVVTQIMHQDGATVIAEQVIGIFEEGQATTAAAPAPTAAAPAPLTPAAASANFGAGVDILVPTLPESVADAVIALWRVKEGDQVQSDDVLVEIETDKIVLEVPAPNAGTVGKILAAENERVVAGQALTQLQAGGPAPAPAPTQAAAPAPAVASKQDTLSPSARRAVGEHGVDANKIQGSGVGGRITKADVSSHQDSQAASQSQLQPQLSSAMGNRDSKRVPMTRIRKRIAQRLVDVKNNTAMLTTFNEVNMQPIKQLRQQYKKSFEEHHGVRLGFMSFYVKAVTEALKRFPAINASIDGDDIVYHNYFDVSVAVSTPRGLVTPVLRNCDQMSFAQIEQNIQAMADKGRNNSLTIEDLTGGNFTITNGGVFGSLMSTPILNPPQSAILGMHAIKDRPMAVNGEVKILPMMYLALSYDHRIVDGKEAVTFLVRVKESLEAPERLVLDL